MTIIRNDDPELLGFELDPWLPLSDEEIEVENAEFQDDYYTRSLTLPNVTATSNDHPPTLSPLHQSTPLSHPWAQKSRASNHLGYNPAERLSSCFKLIQQDMEQAVRTADPDALQKALSDGQRQLSSLQSLKNPTNSFKRSNGDD